MLPNTLGNEDLQNTIPPVIPGLAGRVKVFIVENLRNARRYLKKLDSGIDIDALIFHELNEHTPAGEACLFLKEVEAGEDAAMISEAGVPGVADPGSALAALAHRRGIRVVPLTGPSSILLSLMASGLNGQQFRFHGYLPVKSPERIRRLRDLDQEVQRSGETQIFIEAPYRNMQLLEDLLKTCSAGSMLCIAADLTMESEWIQTREVGRWKKELPSLHKRPVIFLLGRS